MGKRIFDIAVSATALLVLTPLLVLIALLVRFDSRGSPIFKQTRVGRFGRPFEIHKFRTMRTHSGPEGPLLTVGADPRITRLGRLLRQYKLDELPQLWDVLLGNMSLVGPRPELPVYIEFYPRALRDQILSVRPGITDPSSLELRNEGALLAKAADPERSYIEEILPRKLACSTKYLETRTLWSDLELILRTFKELVRKS